ncbi:hypothetical protein [Sphingomonas sp. UYP23]
MRAVSAALESGYGRIAEERRGVDSREEWPSFPMASLKAFFSVMRTAGAPARQSAAAPFSDDPILKIFAFL